MFGRPGISKRQKELARAENRQKKAQRRLERKQQPRTVTANGEDPDIAGIVPGPQPIPNEDE